MADDITVVVEHTQFVFGLEQVLLHLADFVLGEADRTILARHVCEILDHIVHVVPRGADGVVSLAGPLVLRRDIERVARTDGTAALRLLRTGVVTIGTVSMIYWATGFLVRGGVVICPAVTSGSRYTDRDRLRLLRAIGAGARRGVDALRSPGRLIEPTVSVRDILSRSISGHTIAARRIRMRTARLRKTRIGGPAWLVRRRRVVSMSGIPSVL